jgi:RHH-type proline utilization regulon transcriptional repressor/proline dehydrogenase/delta 1-pyrroline-5-carboxylate dehydrogenase
VLRYRPLGPVVLRVDSQTSAQTLNVAMAAAIRCGVSLTVSDASVESDELLKRRVAGSSVERVRSLVPVSPTMRLWLLEQAVGLDESPVSSNGRVELPRWLKEQSISETTHRYGRITESVLTARW